MKRVYRITRSKYKDDLSGEGARLYGGRWNRPGIAALYTSETRSLALLELIVHFNSAAALKMDYVFMTLEIDESYIENIQLKDLPKDFISFNNSKLWAITEEMFFKKDKLAIRVPSVLVPQEFNLIINPIHHQAGLLKVVDKEAAVLDERLVKF